MEPNKLFETIVKERREKLEKYLLECNHYDKERLIRGSKNRGIFANNQNDEQVYNALVHFAKYHNIPLHIDPPKILIKDPVRSTFIEEIDEDGSISLKKLGEDNIKQSLNFRELLEKERDELSKRLLKINELLKLYK